jgi:hypothetical protein
MIKILKFIDLLKESIGFSTPRACLWVVACVAVWVAGRARGVEKLCFP